MNLKERAAIRKHYSSAGRYLPGQAPVCDEINQMVVEVRDNTEMSMTNKKILVIEDEESILELVRYNLTNEGHQIFTATTGEDGLELARKSLPDLIVLDLMLPGVDGLTVCRDLKRDPRTSIIPILMMSALGEESDIIKGLEIGADDYVTKPFSPKVLSARVNAVLRRKVQGRLADESTVSLNGITIDPVKVQVWLGSLEEGSSEIQLTATEFRLLHFLARHPGWVFTRYQIVDAVKGEDYAVTERSVDVQIVGLRRKLGEYGKLIETVRGVGYRFKE